MASGSVFETGLVVCSVCMTTCVCERDVHVPACASVLLCVSMCAHAHVCLCVCLCVQPALRTGLSGWPSGLCAAGTASACAPRTLPGSRGREPFAYLQSLQTAGSGPDAGCLAFCVCSFWASHEALLVGAED